MARYLRSHWAASETERLLQMGQVSSLFKKEAEVSVDLQEAALFGHAKVDKPFEAMQTH